MAHKSDILRAVNRLVTAQEKILAVGGLLDQTVTDRDSPGEETQEDALDRLDQPSLLSIRGLDALLPDG